MALMQCTFRNQLTSRTVYIIASISGWSGCGNVVYHRIKAFQVNIYTSQSSPQPNLCLPHNSLNDVINAIIFSKVPNLEKPAFRTIHLWVELCLWTHSWFWTCKNELHIHNSISLCGPCTFSGQRHTFPCMWRLHAAPFASHWMGCSEE